MCEHIWKGRPEEQRWCCILCQEARGVPTLGRSHAIHDAASSRLSMAPGAGRHGR